jgi:hypothetical protein
VRGNARMAERVSGVHPLRAARSQGIGIIINRLLANAILLSLVRHK